MAVRASEGGTGEGRTDGSVKRVVVWSPDRPLPPATCLSHLISPHDCLPLTRSQMQVFGGGAEGVSAGAP